MSTTALTAPRTVQPVTFPRVLASEWIKLRTVRATVWTLSITLAAMVGIAVVATWATTQLAGTPDGEASMAFSAATFPIAGWFLAQLVVAVLGVLTVTGEYGTGMIRSTFAAVPTRVPALLGKALTVFTVVLAVSAVAVGLSWLAAWPFLTDLGVAIDLGDAQSWRLLAGTPLYLATIAALGFAIGALVRHSAGALAVVLGLLLVVENVLAAIPLRLFELVSPFLPATAGGRLLMDDSTLTFVGTVTDGAQLSPWQGYGVMAAWVAVLLTLACVVTRRRDA